MSTGIAGFVEDRVDSRSSRRRSAFTFAGLGLLALIAALAVGYSTRLSPRIYGDGAGYIMLARNLLAGRGLGLPKASGDFQPLSMHPPLYPLSLAGLGLTGADLLQVARWLDAGLFAGTIVIVGLAVYYISRTPWLAWAAAAVTLSSPLMVGLYTGAASEPLFFLTGVGSLSLLLVYFSTKRRSVLLLSGLAAGLSALTRYPGAAYIGAGIGSLLLFSSSGRVRDTLTYAAVALAPNAAWLVLISRQTGADPPREWDWNLAGLWERAEPIRGGIVAETWKWIPFARSMGAIPYLIRSAVLASLGVAMLCILILSLRRIGRSSRSRSRPLQLIALASLFVGGYMVIVSLVFLFSLPPLDPSDIDQRIMSPINLALVLGIFAGLALATEAWPLRRGIPLAGMVLTILGLASSLPVSWDTVKQSSEVSEGYTSLSWLTSPTLKQASQLPEDVPIITNESAALMFHLDRPAFDIPELQQAEPLPSFTRFGDGNTAQERVFREQGAALVLFDSVIWQLHSIYADQAEARLQALTEGLYLYFSADDGAIYFYEKTVGATK